MNRSKFIRDIVKSCCAPGTEVKFIIDGPNSLNHIPDSVKYRVEIDSQDHIPYLDIVCRIGNEETVINYTFPPGKVIHVWFRGRSKLSNVLKVNTHLGDSRIWSLKSTPSTRS